MNRGFVRRWRLPALRLGALAAVLGGLLRADSGLALDPRSATTNAPRPAESANLAGIWRLDWTQSDSRPRVDGSADFGRSPGEADRHDRTAGGAGRRRPTEDSEGTVLDWARTRLTVQTLIIFQDATRLEISENGRHVERVDIDGTAPPPKTGGAERDVRRGRWEHGDLVTTSEVEGGGTLTETFRLASDGLNLNVVARVRPGSNGPPIVMNRVYRRYMGA